MRQLRNMPLRFKVLVAPVLMVVALGVTLFIALAGMEDQRRVLGELQEVSLKRLQLVQEFITASQLVQSDIYRLSMLQFMQAPEVETEPVFERLETGLNNLTVIHGEILTKWSLDAMEKEILSELDHSLDAFRRQVRQAVRAVTENSPLGVLLVRAAAAPFAELSGLLSGLLDYENGRIAAARRDSEAALGRIEMTVVSIAIAMAIVALSITVVIGSGYISKPIVSVTEAMARLTAGDLSPHGGDAERGDEIGRMEKALQVFRETAIEKAEADRKLHESEARFRNLYHNAQVGLFRTTLDHGVPLQINLRYANLAGYDTIEECMAEFVAAEHYAEPAARARMLEEIGRRGEVTDHEAEIVRKDGSRFWISFSARAYPGDGYIEGALVDITDRKKAEEMLIASLKEKEVLLREIHHRVKNNLQIVSSLLRMGSRQSGDEKAAAIFRESQDRIAAMAGVHTMLYKSSNLSEINFGDYVRATANHLFRSYNTSSEQISFQVDTADIVLPIDAAIPCGLIINELVSNALKHAFPHGRRGEIRIGIEPHEAGISILFEDNGAGFPEGVDFVNSETLGLSLVRMLTLQLGGTVEKAGGAGTGYRITLAV